MSTRAHGARLLDYQLAEPEVLLCKLEKALAGNVTIDSNGPTPLAELLLGTHHLWTGIYFTRNPNNVSEFELHYMQDDERTKMANFPDEQYRGFCERKDHYDNLLENENATSSFRVVVRVTCAHDDYNPPFFTTDCPDSCLTIVSVVPA